MSPINSLPIDVLNLVCQKLDLQSLGRCRRLDKFWKKQVDTPLLWQRLLSRDFAFCSQPLQPIQNPEALYKSNRIYRKNLIQGTFELKTFIGKFGILKFSVIRNKCLMLSQQALHLIDFDHPKQEP